MYFEQEDYIEYDEPEVWKDIPGYEGCYQVSTYGRVYSYLTNKYLSIVRRNNSGYKQVTLCKDGNCISIGVHRLVAMTFNEISQELLEQGYTYDTLQVNHKDENPANNYYKNLEWCTPQYNVMYSNARPVVQIDHNGKIVAEYPSVKDAALALNLNPGNLGKCCLDTIHKYTLGGYVWKYKDEIDLHDFDRMILTSDQCKRISVFDMVGNYIETYMTAKEAGEAYNVQPNHITEVARGQRRSIGDHLYRYYQPEHQPGYILPLLNINNEEDKISQFDREGNLIKVWPNGAVVAKELNVNRSKINRCLNGERPTAIGYIWKKYSKEHIEGYNLFQIDENEVHHKPIIQIDINTEQEIKVYQSIMEAYKEVKKRNSGVNGWQKIYYCCKGLINTAYGYKWNFLFN